MRILVTGASGFVGQAFLKSCPEDWETVCLGRSEVANCKQWIQCNVSNADEMSATVPLVKGELDVIIHLAAYVPKDTDQDSLQESIDVNVMGTANVLEAFGERCHKLVLGSTAEVYDQTAISGVIDENNRVDPFSYYAATKLASELVASSYTKKHAIPLTILRFSVMYGGYDTIARALPNFIRAAKHNTTIHVNNPDTLRDYVHLDDVVASIFAAIREPGCGIINIGSGKGVTIKEASQAVIETTKSASEVVIGNHGAGVDIVMDITKARNCLKFEPQVMFPNKLKDMTELYE